jgi:hypothetical protein
VFDCLSFEAHGLMLREAKKLKKLFLKKKKKERKEKRRAMVFLLLFSSQKKNRFIHTTRRHQIKFLIILIRRTKDTHTHIYLLLLYK